MQRDYNKDWREYSTDLIPSKNKLPDFLFKLLEKEGVKTILDLGCGIGKFSIDLYLKGYSVIGVDINPKAIEIAKTEAQKIIDLSSQNYLRFYVGDTNNLNLESSPFDAVLMQLVISIIGGIEHRKQLLQTSRKLLKKGGLLYLSASGVSDDINPKYAKTYEKDFPLTGEQHTYLSKDSEGKILYLTHHFTENELKELLQTNFKYIKIRKEKEASSRRPDEVAYFLYATAKPVNN